MLVLNKRFSLLATFLTLFLLSTAPTQTSAGVIRVRADYDAPTTTTEDAASITQSPHHQDRPSDLGLPDGEEPDQAASRKGMVNGRWSASRSYTRTRTWTGTWTGTKGWARPTGAPGDSGSDASGSDSSDISKVRTFHS